MCYSARAVFTCIASILVLLVYLKCKVLYGADTVLAICCMPESMP